MDPRTQSPAFESPSPADDGASGARGVRSPEIAITQDLQEGKKTVTFESPSRNLSRPNSPNSVSEIVENHTEIGNSRVMKKRF